jgi:membrane-associated phospholipid phosphatase
VAAGLSVALLHAVFVTTLTGRVVDRAALDGAELGRTRLWQVAEPVLAVVSVPFVVAVVVTTALLAVLRRRVVLAVQVTLLVAGANLTTQVLKEFLVRPDVGLGDRLVNTMPSGHTTVAGSASAALLLVVPRRLRPAVAIVGAAYTVATGVSTLVGGWHRPADVVAAIAVVLAWAGFVTAIDTRGARTRLDGVRGGARGLASLLVALAVPLGALAAVAMYRTATEPLVSRTDMLVAYAGGVLGVAAAGSLAFGVLVAVVAAADPRED